MPRFRALLTALQARLAERQTRWLEGSVPFGASGFKSRDGYEPRSCDGARHPAPLGRDWWLLAMEAA